MIAQEIMDMWRGVAQSKSFAHPLDKHVLSQSTARFPPGRVPEPWFGNPAKASIFTLTLNPGHGENDVNHGVKTHEFFWSMMAGNAGYGDYLSNISEDGLNWGRKNYRDFLEHSMTVICNLRLVAYPSPDKAAMGNFSADPARLLPTAKRMIDFVHGSLVPAAREGRCLLLVMRSPYDWGFGKPETDSWDKGLFISRSLRNASIAGPRVGPAIREWLGKQDVSTR